LVCIHSLSIFRRCDASNQRSEWYSLVVTQPSTRHQQLCVRCWRVCMRVLRHLLFIIAVNLGSRVIVYQLKETRTNFTPGWVTNAAFFNHHSWHGVARKFRTLVPGFAEIDPSPGAQGSLQGLLNTPKTYTNRLGRKWCQGFCFKVTWWILSYYHSIQSYLHKFMCLNIYITTL
jgi:hypothetical protein